jgi:peptidoglycan-associated lipoprotein
MHNSSHYKTAIAASLLVALLAGCASSVSLDENKVTDAKGVPVHADAGSKSEQAPPAVKEVMGTSEAAALQGPTNVARLVYFDYDSYVVKPEFQSVIEAHARHLTRFKSAKIVIEGHTDERGGREYNLALGQKRSEAVLKSFSILGVPQSQMEAVSFGKEKLADQGTSEEAMAKNRRAQINYR